MPKYANHLLRGKKEFPVDSIAFIVGDQYHICDRTNAGEQPILVVSYVNYPREERVQVRFALKGNFHVEQLKYYSKNPDSWVEKIWIAIPLEVADKLTDFLANADPTRVATYV